MIILRNKIFSSSSPQAPVYNPDADVKKEDKNSNARLAGEVIGTSLIGAGGALAASDLAKKSAEKVVGIREGKKAKAAYRDYLKTGDYRRLKGLEQIEAQKNLEQAPYKKNWLKKILNRSKIKDAEYVAEGRKSRLMGKINAENLAKKKELIAARDAKIAKAGKLGKKVGLLGGLAVGTGLVAKKIYDNRKRNEK